MGLPSNGLSSRSKDIGIFGTLISDIAVKSEDQHLISEIVETSALLDVFLFLGGFIMHRSVNKHCNSFETIPFIVEVRFAVRSFFWAVLSAVWLHRLDVPHDAAHSDPLSQPSSFQPIWNSARMFSFTKAKWPRGDQMSFGRSLVWGSILRHTSGASATSN